MLVESGEFHKDVTGFRSFLEGFLRQASLPFLAGSTRVSKSKHLVPSFDMSFAEVSRESC